MALPRSRLVAEITARLNCDQQAIFRECIEGSSSVFCTGQGGTGKSKVLESIVEYFRSAPLENGDYVSVTASTGIASFVVKGMTLHRFAGVGIEERDVDIMYQKASTGASKQYWMKTGILIIDEISMVSPVFFDNLSKVASRIRNNPIAFGGIRLLMFGDFLQLPPISSSEDVSRRVFHTDAWRDLSLKTMQLKAVVRQTSPDYINILSQIRYGVCSQSTTNYLRCLDYEPEYEDGIDAVRLFARRKDADAYNGQMLGTLDNDIVVFTSYDRGTVSTLKQCPAPDTIHLKLGCQVILTRNLSDQAVNGSVGTITSFEDTRLYPFKKPVVTFLDQNNETFDMTIPYSLWEVVAPNGTVTASRSQLPLLLAWAITIHRSQAQTINRLCIDMSGIFEVGQAYVALSRCPDPSGLTVHNFRQEHVMASRSCIEFYQRLDEEGPSENLPLYDAPPQYEEDDHTATSVAPTTQQQWGRTQVQSPYPLATGNRASDTEMMMGNLSIRTDSQNQTPTEYHQESENS